MIRLRDLCLLATIGLAGCAGAPRLARSTCLTERAEPGARVLVFFRVEEPPYHSSIPKGLAAIEGLGRRHGFVVEETENPKSFSDANLTRYSAVVFLNTIGDVLDAEQQIAFEKYVRAGGGFVGVHAAAHTESEWEWYGRLVGARFKRLTGPWTAEVIRRDSAHLSSRCIPRRWSVNDEWYDFLAPPGPGIAVLATVDEASYHNGGMGSFHPIAWAHEFEGGRAWYTGIGHRAEIFSDAVFLDHLAGGILWAAR